MVGQVVKTGPMTKMEGVAVAPLPPFLRIYRERRGLALTRRKTRQECTGGFDDWVEWQPGGPQLEKVGTDQSVLGYTDEGFFIGVFVPGNDSVEFLPLFLGQFIQRLKPYRGPALKGAWDQIAMLEFGFMCVMVMVVVLPSIGMRMMMIVVFAHGRPLVP